MKVYEVFVINDDNTEYLVSTYATMEEAEKHRAYLESLPWSIRPGVDWTVVEANVFDKFEPYYTDEEIASARKWDEEHKNEIINNK